MFLSLPKSSVIVPVNLLSERSITLIFNASTTRGISPDNWFLKRYTILKFFGINKLLGILPVRLFFDKSKCTKASISPIVSGISPFKLDPEIHKYSSFFNCVKLGDFSIGASDLWPVTVVGPEEFKGFKWLRGSGLCQATISKPLETFKLKRLRENPILL